MVTKTKPTLHEVRLALGKVMKAKSVGYMDYAKTYANAALQMGMEGHILENQLLYVLNNLQQWRGEEARQTKVVLKSYAGVK